MRLMISAALVTIALLVGAWLFTDRAEADSSNSLAVDCQDGPQVTSNTPFTYQGRLLEQGAPANGSYNFAFAIYDQSSGGSQLSEHYLCFVLQVTDGFFTVELPFASQLFTGAPRYLEIGVRPAASADSHKLLSPRRRITAEPYSIHADYAGQADNAARFGGREPATFADKEHSHSTLAAPDGSKVNVAQVLDANTINVNGALRINNLPPVRIIRFRNIGHETNLSTGVSAQDYECVPTGWSTKYDVYESSAYTYMVWTFVYQDTWHVTVKFGSEADHEDPDVDILCFHKGLVSWEAGSPGVDRGLWEPD